MIKTLVLAIILCSALCSAKVFANPVESSHTIFFAPEVKKNLTAQQSFPIFWWNFIVVENLNPEQLQEFCKKLHSTESRSFVERTECGVSLNDYTDIIADWAQDLPLRQAFDSKAARESLNQSLAQLSVIMGAQDVAKILIKDPMGTWKELKNKTEQRLKIPFPRVNGFFTDAETQRVLIPVLFKYPPSEISKTNEFEILLPPQAHLVGAHRSYLENEKQVILDVRTVSIVGAVILVLFALFVIVTKRSVAALLIPPVLIAVSVATALTILIFGSVHGLTLAFGSGIIGLALDYGLHGALNNKSKNTWISNFIGLLTTLSGLLILSFSSVPLLKQMMVFSILGLLIGFTMFYYLLKVFPDKLSIKPFKITQKPSKYKTLGIFGLIVISIFGLFTAEPKLELKQFDFQDKKTFELASWIQTKMELRPPLMRFHNEDQDLKLAHEELEWAKQNDIALENSANYLPPLEVQTKNISTWTDCGLGVWSSNQKQAFAKFFETTVCASQNVKPKDNVSSVPKYLSHLSSEDLRLTLWLPQTDEESAKIQTRFPDSLSLMQVVSKFPQGLSKELKWMVPLSVVLASLIILLHYKKVWYLVLALVPFFSGLGLVFAVMKIAHIEMSFITVIGLIMVFGFSVDYGIFMTDIFRDSEEAESEPAVLTALGFAALTNLIGFAPMLFAKHPVLFHLGVALFFGTLGTFVGAIWGIPGFVEWRAKRK